MTNIFEKPYRFEKTDRNTFLKFPHAMFRDPQYAKIPNDAKPAIPIFGILAAPKEV